MMTTDALPWRRRDTRVPAVELRAWRGWSVLASGPGRLLTEPFEPLRAVLAVLADGGLARTWDRSQRADAGQYKWVRASLPSVCRWKSQAGL